MTGKALGLIETKGLIGAIEASDAAAKSAAVVVSSVELTDAAFITLKIQGDLGAVQAAVKAGSQAAEKIGELIAAHVIPNPSEGLALIMPERRYISKYHPDDDRPPLDADNAESDLPVKQKPTKPSGTTSKPNETATMKKLELMTVSQLRQIARSLKQFPLKGREISMANKSQLLDAFKSVKKMD